MYHKRETEEEKKGKKKEAEEREERQDRRQKRNLTRILAAVVGERHRTGRHPGYQGNKQFPKVAPVPFETVDLHEPWIRINVLIARKKGIGVENAPKRKTRNPNQKC